METEENGSLVLSDRTAFLFACWGVIMTEKTTRGDVGLEHSADAGAAVLRGYFQFTDVGWGQQGVWSHGGQNGGARLSAGRLPRRGERQRRRRLWHYRLVLDIACGDRGLEESFSSQGRAG